eukprot:16225-Heterococcus_DN1.PRE.2
MAVYLSRCRSSLLCCCSAATSLSSPSYVVLIVLKDAAVAAVTLKPLYADAAAPRYRCDRYHYQRLCEQNVHARPAAAAACAITHCKVKMHHHSRQQESQLISAAPCDASLLRYST